MPALNADSLSRRYSGGVFALREVTFEVGSGRIAALFGPSGAGKTSVLRLLAGLDEPDGGDIRIDGESVLRLPPHRRGVGLMFQELALFPHLDVHENVAFGLRMARWKKVDRVRRVTDLLELLGLAGLADRRVDELSGGERQRVALARTLAPQPRIALLDEPLGAIDEERKQTLRGDLRTLLQATRSTAVIVSHDLRDATAIADDIIVMDTGRVLQAGPMSLVLTYPASAQIAAMLGYVTLANGQINDGYVTEIGVGEVPLPEGVKVETPAVVMAHPASLLAVPPQKGLGCGVGGRVTSSHPDGPLPLVEVVLGGRRMEVRWEWDRRAPAIGEVVEIAALPDSLRFYDAPRTGLLARN